MPITIDHIKEMRLERRNLQSQGEQVLKDIAAARKANDETREKELGETFTRIHSDVRRLDQDIDRAETQHDAEKRDTEIEQRIERKGKQPERVIAGRQDADGDEAPEELDDEERAAAVREANLAYLRHGFSGMTPEQRSIYQGRFQSLSAAEQGEVRAMGVGSDTAGGFLVAPEFENRIVEAMQAFGGMRRARTFQFTTATGAELSIPTDNDVSNTGELLGEGDTATPQDVTVGQVKLGAYTYSSKLVKVHVSLLQDSAFDIEAWLANKLGMRLGRISNTHFTTGDGAAKPEGVVTGSTQGKQGATGQSTSITIDDVYALKHSVDPDYREGAEWMFSDNTLLKFKQLQDGEGRPLWQSGVAVGEPNTIDGDPYVINQDVADMAASAKSVLYGAFPNYYIRTVRGVTLVRFGERYMDALQVGFLAFSRLDGVLVDAGTNPIKHYANSAS